MQYRKQHEMSFAVLGKGCDLLEKSYFCSIANNKMKKLYLHKFVVICLKNRTFAVSQTTGVYEKEIVTSCDLLEKSYFCSIANNPASPRRNLSIVVICLKNRTFAVSQTTDLSEWPIMW